jgi:hypothetical protein
MISIKKAAFGALLGASTLVLSAASASAAIVCNGNVCWHVQETYDYPPEARIIVHPDDWRWGPSEQFTFREHEGRGYWDGDRWSNW